MRQSLLCRSQSRAPRIALVLLAATAAAGVGACNRDSRETSLEVANQAVESASQTTAEAELLVTLLGDVDPSLSPEDMATAAAASATQMQPPDCATVQSTATQVTWTFTQCTGALGLITLDGSVTLSFRVGPRGKTVDLSSSGLEVSGVPVELGGIAVYTSSGTSNTLEVDTNASAQTTRFGSLQRTGSYTVTWEDGASCLQVDGTWSTSLGARSWDTTATALTACDGSCLVGTLTFARTGSSYALSFLAGGEVEWTTSSGKTGTIQLPCGQ